jgi:hypothetical protein
MTFPEALECRIDIFGDKREDADKLCYCDLVLYPASPSISVPSTYPLLVPDEYDVEGVQSGKRSHSCDFFEVKNFRVNRETAAIHKGSVGSVFLSIRDGPCPLASSRGN